MEALEYLITTVLVLTIACILLTYFVQDYTRVYLLATPRPELVVYRYLQVNAVRQGSEVLILDEGLYHIVVLDPSTVEVRNWTEAIGPLTLRVSPQDWVLIFRMDQPGIAVLPGAVLPRQLLVNHLGYMSPECKPYVVLGPGTRYRVVPPCIVIRGTTCEVYSDITKLREVLRNFVLEERGLVLYNGTLMLCEVYRSPGGYP